MCRVDGSHTLLVCARLWKDVDPDQYGGSWRLLFLKTPHVHFHGTYVCICTFMYLELIFIIVMKLDISIKCLCCTLHGFNHLQL